LIRHEFNADLDFSSQLLSWVWWFTHERARASIVDLGHSMNLRIAVMLVLNPTARSQNRLNNGLFAIFSHANKPWPLFYECSLQTKLDQLF